MLDNVRMIEIGSLVRVLYPDYAEGRVGIVEARESTGRWLIRLDPWEHDRDPLILSLEERDFEVIRSPLP
ncbi:hypothetical protein V0288_12905 [Pannus brasiliensis CCIBt3594]|uniref:DUF4926 domain-containing protein n=1 Tax=Pannus brasiliensis CCIBt3594 TaxID=1427578 RepID=A0AAW9QM86_9CHRO